MKGVTLYSGISQYYFKTLLNSLVAIGGLESSGARTLDFGCGNGELKRMFPKCNVINYDIIPELSEVDDWRSVDFDVLLSNQVFYCFEENELDALLQELRDIKPNIKLVIGISRQGWFNNVGKYLLGKKDAHEQARIRPEIEVGILKKYCDIKQVKGVFFLADVYSMSFKQDCGS